MFTVDQEALFSDITIKKYEDIANPNHTNEDIPMEAGGNKFTNENIDEEKD